MKIFINTLVLSMYSYFLNGIPLHNLIPRFAFKNKEGQLLTFLNLIKEGFLYFEIEFTRCYLHAFIYIIVLMNFFLKWQVKYIFTYMFRNSMYFGKRLLDNRCFEPDSLLQ